MGKDGSGPLTTSNTLDSARWVEVDDSDEEFRIELSNEVAEEGSKAFSSNLLEEIAGEGLLGLVKGPVVPARDDD